MVEYLRRRADRDGQGVVPVRTSQQPLLPPRTSPTSTALRRAGCSCRHVRFSCFPGTWRHRGWSGCASNWRRRHQRRSSFELPPAAGMLRQWSLKLVLLWPMGLNRPLNTLYVLFTSIFLSFLPEVREFIRDTKPRNPRTNTTRGVDCGFSPLSFFLCH